MPGTATVRAALYCRISRAEEAKGVERQRKAGLRLAREKGWDVAESAIYIDNNKSASEFSKKARQRYLDLLADIEAGKYDAIILWMEDRGHRQVMEAAEFVNLCLEHNVTRVAIVSDEREYDFTDPTHRAEWSGKAAQAQMETAKMSKRQRAAKRQEALDGKPRGGWRAFGYEGVTRDDHGNVANRERAGIAVVPEEADLIRDAARRILQGESVRGLVNEWNAKGLRTPHGAQWSRQSLRDVLLRPRTAGLREYHGEVLRDDDGNEVQAVWEPILDRQTWEGVTAMLTDPGRAMGRSASPKYLLIGVLHCARCGARMTGQPWKSSKGEKRLTYVCRTGEPYNGCGARRNAAALEEWITKALIRAVEGQALAEAMAEGNDDTAVQRRELADQQAALGAKQGRLETLLVDGDLDRQAYKRQRARVEGELEQVRSRLASLTRRSVVSDLPSNLGELWDDMTMDQKRAIVRAVIARIDVEPIGRGFNRAFDPEKVLISYVT